MSEKTDEKETNEEWKEVDVVTDGPSDLLVCPRCFCTVPRIYAKNHSEVPHLVKRPEPPLLVVPTINVKR